MTLAEAVERILEQTGATTPTQVAAILHHQAGAYSTVSEARVAAEMGDREPRYTYVHGECGGTIRFQHSIHKVAWLAHCGRCGRRPTPSQVEERGA